MAVMVGANGICLAAYGERGCGVSLDYSPIYTLPGGDVNQRNHTVVAGETKWNDPSYISDRARLVRHRCLLGMSLMECDFGRRLVLAAIGGGIIGFERRSADRPAGVRVMSLVSLGSAIFTLCSTWGFLTGPQEWDASRISAAIPSGVGFLGAGLIWKGTQEGTGHHTVHGITTAASVWISASVGISCGGGLYFPAITGATLCIFVLRYGPRLYMGESETEKESECAEKVAWGDMEEFATMDDFRDVNGGGRCGHGNGSGSGSSGGNGDGGNGHQHRRTSFRARPTQDIPRPQRVQQLKTGHVRPAQQQQRRESWTDARAFFDGAEEHVVPFPGSVRAGANSCGDPRAAVGPSASAGTDSLARRESNMSLASARPSLGSARLSFLRRRPAHAHVFDCES